MRTSRSLSFHDQVRFLRILFFMLLAGQALFFAVALVIKESIIIDYSVVTVFDYLVPVILFAGIFLSRLLYRSMVNRGKTLSFSRKTETYRNAVIVSLAVLEGANMVSIAAFMLTSEALYAAASAILFLLFVLNIPTEDKFRTDLELTPGELEYTE